MAGADKDAVDLSTGLLLPPDFIVGLAEGKSSGP